MSQGIQKQSENAMRRAFSVDIDNIDRGGEHWKKLGYLQIKGWTGYGRIDKKTYCCF